MWLLKIYYVEIATIFVINIYAGYMIYEDMILIGMGYRIIL